MSEFQSKLIEYIKNELLIEEHEVKADTSLFRENILDSLSLSELIVYIEDNYKIKVAPMDIVFENFDSVIHIENYVNRRLGN